MDELGDNRSPQWYRAEVERLSAVNADAQKSVDELLTSRNALLAKVAKLEAENAEAVETVSGMVRQRNEWIERKRQLEAENAELRARNVNAEAEAELAVGDNETLRATLAWFEKAWPLVRDVRARYEVDEADGEWADFNGWEMTNPKPSEGT